VEVRLRWLARCSSSLEPYLGPEPTLSRVIALSRHDMVSGEIHRHTVRSRKVREGNEYDVLLT
jgi:hypothetical protein